MMDDRKVKAEEVRLGKLLGHVTDGKQELARGLVKNIAFDTVRLLEMRESLKGQPDVIGYDNGGGQSGIRKNPLLELYISLTKQYVSEVKELAGLVVDDASDDDIRGTVLDEIMRGRGVA